MRAPGGEGNTKKINAAPSSTTRQLPWSAPLRTTLGPERARRSGRGSLWPHLSWRARPLTLPPVGLLHARAKVGHSKVVASAKSQEKRK